VTPTRCTEAPPCGSILLEVVQELGGGVGIGFNALTHESLQLDIPVIEDFKFPPLSGHSDPDHERLITNAPYVVLDVTTIQLCTEIEEALVAHESILDRESGCLRTLGPLATIRRTGAHHGGSGQCRQLADSVVLDALIGPHGRGPLPQFHDARPLLSKALEAVDISRSGAGIDS
jgi:hypothetical protein